jgi:hypothetical protein
MWVAMFAWPVITAAMLTIIAMAYKYSRIDSIVYSDENLFLFPELMMFATILNLNANSGLSYIVDEQA